MFAVSRRELLMGVALAGLGSAAGGCSASNKREGAVLHGERGVTEDTTALTPDQALTKLVDGNGRFVAMTEVEPNLSTQRLIAVSAGQHPFVGVLGCVDSRVPPELIFDRGLGDIFDSRIAGAIADDAAIGSLEFGVEEFAVPLLVVLGHSRCGAVTAAVKAVGSGGGLPGKVGTVVDPILPAVRANQALGKSGDDLVNSAARDVVRNGVRALTASTVLAERLSSGKLKVMGAFYDLDSGKVEFLDR